MLLSVVSNNSQALSILKEFKKSMSDITDENDTKKNDDKEKQ